jgi:hypothetical protein
MLTKQQSLRYYNRPSKTREKGTNELQSLSSQSQDLSDTGRSHRVAANKVSPSALPVRKKDSQLVPLPSPRKPNFKQAPN